MSEYEQPPQDEEQRRKDVINNLSPIGIREALEKELAHCEDTRMFIQNKINAIKESLDKFS